MKTTFVGVLLMTAFSALAQPAGDYTVHEWGTFTSVQGGDGRLIPWRPIQSSELPRFVHDWFNPGLRVLPQYLTPGGKGGLVTLQRMETPVIYFYSRDTLSVDVSVAFPKGIITEWYPRSNQIGPAELDYVGPAGGFPAIDKAASLRESRITWRKLTVFPPYATQVPAPLPVDQQGRHYFAARETDSDNVQIDLSQAPGGTNETERFLFYRGAGSFATPLHVAMDSTNGFEVSNTGTNPLAHLFFLRVQDGYGEFASMDSLPAGQTNWQANWEGTETNGWRSFPLAQFQDALGAQVEAALVNQGLFDKEARAMVKTWRDSWFTEEGMRVLYILPRAWTDETLPMTLNPLPQQLTRVMVGRAEIIAPAVQTNLLSLLTRAQNGDADARLQAGATFKKLGRFALPALNLAISNDYTNAVAALGLKLLSDAMQAPN
jgi:hypothetical protein